MNLGRKLDPVEIRGRHITQGQNNVINVPKLTMEDYSEIGHFNVLEGNKPVCLLNNAVVSHHCVLLTTMRTSWGRMDRTAPEGTAEVREGDIIIGPGAYIGPFSTICPGVVIGRNSVVGAGSYITKDLPDYTVIRFKGKKCEVPRIMMKDSTREEEEI
jgi:acetyltransferase-like isoleucine patch superfamily enzyme